MQFVRELRNYLYMHIIRVQSNRAAVALSGSGRIRRQLHPVMAGFHTFESGTSLNFIVNVIIIIKYTRRANIADSAHLWADSL